MYVISTFWAGGCGVASVLLRHRSDHVYDGQSVDEQLIDVAAGVIIHAIPGQALQGDWLPLQKGAHWGSA